MRSAERVTEKLKAQNSMEWVRQCNNIHNRAAEIIMQELIYAQLIFPRKLGKRIVESEEIRHASDYDDFYIATREEAEEQIQTAKELVKLVEEYVRQRWDQENGLQE